MRGIGLPIETLIEYARLYQQGDETIDRRKEILMEQRNQLTTRMQEMNNVLERMNIKIAGYELKLRV